MLIYKIFLLPIFTNKTFDAGLKTVSGMADSKIKEANAYADATRDDLEKVLIETKSR